MAKIRNSEKTPALELKLSVFIFLEKSKKFLEFLSYRNDVCYNKLQAKKQGVPTIQLKITVAAERSIERELFSALKTAKTNNF